MKSFYLIAFTLVALISSSVTTAYTHKTTKKNTVKLPTGCLNVGHKYDLYNVIFKPTATKSRQTIYFIHNIGNKSVYLHEAGESDKPYVMYINGKISPDNWSVLAVTKKQIKFNCTYFDENKKQHRVINCKDALEICEFPKALFGPNHRGTYWVLYNTSRKSAVNMTRNHGVWLNARHDDD